jgi:hypothetical protein
MFKTLISGYVILHDKKIILDTMKENCWFVKKKTLKPCAFTVYLQATAIKQKISRLNANVLN